MASKTQKRFSPAVKRRAVQQLLSGERTPAEITKRYKVTSTSLYTWAKDPRCNPALTNGAAPPPRPVSVDAKPPKGAAALRDRVQFLEQELGKRLIAEYYRKRGL